LSGAPIALAIFVAAGCAIACSSSSSTSSPPEPPCKETAGPFAPLSTRCRQLVDAQGRVVILRGVNVRAAGAFDADMGAGKKPRFTLPALDDADLARMRRIGFSVVRLPIQWSGVEPNDHDPPQYDDAYLASVDAVIARAAAAHLKILVDFHQDAYSKYIGQDGAPLWAIVPAPTELAPDGFVSPGDWVLKPEDQNAFTTFFKDRGADGTKLRDRFGKAVAAVMARHVGDDSIVGVDVYNEPLASDDDLKSFAEQIGAAVRAVDPKRLVFFESPATRNEFDHASLASAPLSLDGVVYAPHVYTHVFITGDDSQWRATFTKEDLRPSNQSARDEADSWHAPLFVGEFGWGPTDARFADYIGWQLDLQDEYMASSTFWLWKEQDESSGGGGWGLFDRDPTTGSWTERAAARRVFARVVPEAIGGWPESWNWDATTRRFTLKLIGDDRVTAPTLLHLPTPEDVTGAFHFTCDNRSVDATPDADGVVAIACGGAGEHVIVASEGGT
jgi:endoglycosylceramidase